MTSKQDILEKVYFNDAGHGSKQSILKESREKDKTVTMSDIDIFFRKHVEQKKTVEGFQFICKSISIL